MTIQAIARDEVVTIRPDAPITEVARTMAEERIGSLVVTDDREALLGIVTDRDLALDVLGAGKDPDTVTARDVMAEDLFTVDADAGVFETINEMCDAGVRRVPVVDGDRLSGIVTLDDFIVLLSGELENLAAIIQAESPPYAKA